jgi:hypothetical protein
MGFLIKENELVNYVYCKLTDEGRRKIAEGNFNPTFFSVADSEMDYVYYNDLTFPLVGESYVLKPIDKHKILKYQVPKNESDTDFKYQFNSLDSEIVTYLREVPDKGLFEGDTYSYTAITDSNYTIQSQIRIDNTQLTLDNNKILNVVKNTNYGANINEPNVGDYLLVNWKNPYVDVVDNFNNGVINSNVLTPFLWYKIVSIDGLLSDNTLEITLDRDLPNFGTGNTLSYSYGIIYPKYNSMEGFYNSVSPSDYWNTDVLNFNTTINNFYVNINANILTLEANVWNFNIVFTEDIAGLLENSKKLRDQYSSKYAGLITYLTNPDFEHKNIGIIHYSNNNPFNLYGETFVDNIFINLPTILWHKNEDNKIGVQFKSDDVLKTFSDENFELKYFYLIDDWDNVVGTIFPDLKLITITDQELLYAMSYKSNRNWTLVEPNAQFVDDGCPVDIGTIGTFFYGTYELLGGNVTIPTENDINISSGVAVNNVNLNDFAITIPYNSQVNDFIWFAIPSIFPLRTEWFVNVLNRGDIGGAKIISGNLFPDPVLVTYNNIEYRLYISNYRTNAEFIDILT